MSPSHRGRPSLFARPITWLLVAVATVLIAIGAILMGGSMLSGGEGSPQVSTVSAPVTSSPVVSVEARPISSREELPTLTTAA